MHSTLEHAFIGNATKGTSTEEQSSGGISRRPRQLRPLRRAPGMAAAPTRPHSPAGRSQRPYVFRAPMKTRSDGIPAVKAFAETPKVNTEQAGRMPSILISMKTSCRIATRESYLEVMNGKPPLAQGKRQLRGDWHQRCRRQGRHSLQ